MNIIHIRHQHFSHDEPDGIGVTILPAGMALLIVFTLALLLWCAIALAVAWATGNLPW